MPVDVSWVGLSGALKSPPNTSVPFLKEANNPDTEFKNDTWCEFGAYMLASVMVRLRYVPFRNKYVPSAIDSDSWIGQCLAINMETPFDLILKLVAWCAVGK